MTHANGVTTTYQYDAASQLLSLVHQLGATTINSFDYSYDKVGNRKTKADNNGTANYTYDTLNRLLQATNPLPSNPLESFTYDEVGNRVNSNQNGASVFNQANQLTEDANFTYQYDNNGNLIRKTNKVSGQLTSYEYDAENKLVKVVQNGTVVNYKYDSLGRRIEKEIIQGPVTNVTRFVYDNEDILLELDGNNQIVARYTHGPGIDEPLIIEKAGVSSFYHSDGLGSITELTDTAGTVAQSYAYSSFGKIESQLDPNFIQPYTFTAREFDVETGLYYYRARTYDPRIGRFLQEDPLRLSSGDLNFFVYTINNPVRFVDSTGLYITSLLYRGLNTAFRLGGRSYDIAIQSRIGDSFLGGLATAAGFAPNVRNTTIPGLGGITVGNVVDGVGAWGGYLTANIGFGIAATKVGLSTAALTAVGGATAATVGSAVLVGIGSFELGTAFNNLVLENRSVFPCGNPITRFITNPLFDLLHPEA